jgi:DNA-binding response OmpR family regulator
MSLYDDGFAVSRGTVLVASGNNLFMDIVRGMVAECGLAVVSALTSEPAWLSVMRAQPALVICDWDAPPANLAGVIGEATARHVPLLMAWSRDRHGDYAQGLALPERVAWLTFPVGRDEFRSTVDGLLAPEIDSVHHVSLAVPGVRLSAAVRVRTLSLLA